MKSGYHDIKISNESILLDEETIYSDIFNAAYQDRENSLDILLKSARDQYAAKNAAVLGYALVRKKNEVDILLRQGANINCAIFGYEMSNNPLELLLLAKVEKNPYLKGSRLLSGFFHFNDQNVNELLQRAQYEKKQSRSIGEVILNKIGDMVFNLFSFFSITPPYAWIRPIDNDYPISKFVISTSKYQTVKLNKEWIGYQKENNIEKPKKVLISKNAKEIVYLADKAQQARLNLFSHPGMDYVHANKKEIQDKVKKYKADSATIMRKLKKDAEIEMTMKKMMKLTKVTYYDFKEASKMDKYNPPKKNSLKAIEGRVNGLFSEIKDLRNEGKKLRQIVKDALEEAKTLNQRLDNVVKGLNNKDVADSNHISKTF